MPLGGHNIKHTSQLIFWYLIFQSLQMLLARHYSGTFWKYKSWSREWRRERLSFELALYGENLYKNNIHNVIVLMFHMK